jgi:hypothetical protein
MAEGNALFSAAHHNLMPAAALDAASLGTACATLATNSQHGRPAFGLVGTAEGQIARTLTATPTTASGALTVIQMIASPVVGT